MPYYGDQKREYDRLRASTARAVWVAEQGGVCVKCGSSEQIEIDHVDPSAKEYKIATIWSRKKEIREAELAKCQLLCYSCHKEKTITENIKEFEHGTFSMYQSRKCRCQECRAANAERCARQRYIKKHLRP
jgi:5-methylcytosine-specific restriction endonuclease McrA